jgi:hypothetical protein
MAAGKGPFFVPGWMIEQIQKSKWEPAFRPELRRNSTLQRFRDSGGGGNALISSHEEGMCAMPWFGPWFGQGFLQNSAAGDKPPRSADLNRLDLYAASR